MKFERKDNFTIEVTDGKGQGSIDTQSVECCLLYAILEKLEEIRGGLVDVETAVEEKIIT